MANIGADAGAFLVVDRLDQYQPRVGRVSGRRQHQPHQQELSVLRVVREVRGLGAEVAEQVVICLYF